MINVETYLIVQCVECGEQDEAAYMESMSNKMVSRSLCFTCLFWIELTENRDNDQRVAVDGTHYIILRRERAATLVPWVWWIAVRDQVPRWPHSTLNEPLVSGRYS